MASSIMSMFPEFFGVHSIESIENRVKAEKILEIKKHLNLDSNPVIRKVYDCLVANGFPVENFLKNLEALELRHVAEDSVANSSYIASKNILYYRNDEELYHELSHMASTNFISRINGLANVENHTIAVNEGITDYFARLANPFYELAYPTEYYVISILQKIFGNDVFKSYFNSDSKGFVNSIKDKEVKALIYLLDVYSCEINELIDQDRKYISDKVMVLTEITQKRDDLRHLVVKILDQLNKLANKYKIDVNVYQDYIKMLEDGIDNSMSVIDTLTLYEPLTLDADGKYVLKSSKDNELDEELSDEEIDSIYANDVLFNMLKTVQAKEVKTVSAKKKAV